MRKSEPILPLPIYTDLFDQYRFSSLCDDGGCQQELIYPTNEMPFFQFVRDKTLQTATQLVARNICSDKSSNYYKLIPEYITMTEDKYLGHFNTYPIAGGIYDDGVNPPFGGTTTIAKIDCGKLVNENVDSNWTFSSDATIDITGIPNTNTKVHFKISVDHLKRASTFSIKIYSGADLIGTITSAGVYNYTYASTSNTITVEFTDYAPGDEFEISHMQARYVNPLNYAGYVTDISLDATKIKIKQIDNDRDVITYCEGAKDYNVKPGTYYYILNMNGEVYFSETFTVKTPKELEKYFRLYWMNSCDINESIIYSVASLVCLFYHAIYLDAALFTPEYNTDVEEQQNGMGDKTPTFKRWQKSIKLDVQKSPPFLTDALSAILLHDTIYLKEPLNDKQETGKQEYQIEGVTPEVKDILLNCYQNVLLKLVLSSRFTGKNCCDTIAFFDCTQTQTPTLDNQSEPFSGIFLLEGTGLKGSFAVVEYKLNGGSWVQTTTYQAIDANGDYAVLFDTNDLVGIVDLDVRIRSKTIACDFGISAEMDII